MSARGLLMRSKTLSKSVYFIEFRMSILQIIFDENLPQNRSCLLNFRCQDVSYLEV